MCISFKQLQTKFASVEFGCWEESGSQMIGSGHMMVCTKKQHCLYNMNNKAVGDFKLSAQDISKFGEIMMGIRNHQLVHSARWLQHHLM